MEFAAFLACGGLICLGVVTVLCIVALSQIATLREQMARLQRRLELLERTGMEGTGATVREAARQRIVQAPVAVAEPPKANEAAVIAVAPAVAPVAEEKQEEPAGVVDPETMYEVVAKEKAALMAEPAPEPVAYATLRRKEKEPLGLEVFLGTRIFVAVGAIALALAAIYFIKFAVDNGWLNPEVRVIGGAAAGVAMLGLAQWRRKRETFIAQGLSAAGIVALYAATYGAAMVYAFVSKPTGFGAMAAITALCAALSLQREGGGQLLAGLGLFGGFLTPLLIGSEKPNVPGLFGYLVVLHLAMVGVTRARGWSVLAALSVMLASAWVLVWMLVQPLGPGDAQVLSLFILVATGSLIVSTIGEPMRWRGEGAVAAHMTWVAALAGLATGASLLWRAHFVPMEWGYFGLLVAGAMVIGRMRATFEPLAWLANGVLLMMVWWWSGKAAGMGEVREQARWIVPVLGAAFSLGAYGCLWKSGAPVRWAALHVVLAVAYVVTAYAVIGEPRRPEWWALVSIGAAAVMAGLAVPVYARRGAMATGEGAMTWVANGVLVLVAVAAPMALEHATLTAAWAVLLPLAALALWQLRIGGLGYGLMGLWLLGIFRGALFVFMISLAANNGGEWWRNPVVWTYGSLLLAALLTVPMLPECAGVWKKHEESLPDLPVMSVLVQAGALVAAVVLVTLEVRWCFQEGNLVALAMDVTERATYPAAWFGLAGVFGLVAKVRKTVAARVGAIVMACTAMLAALFLNGVFTNPVLTGENVGEMPVWNLLLYVYGLPAVVSGLIAWKAAGLAGKGRDLSRFAGVVAMVLTFILVTMEVRQGFEGSVLSKLEIPTREMMAYSLAWAGLGGTYLVAGVISGSALLRWASLCLMLLTVVKVFLVDMAGLKDLLRVMSFAGLGVSLMVLAFVYQRFVFRKPVPEGPVTVG